MKLRQNEKTLKFCKIGYDFWIGSCLMVNQPKMNKFKKTAYVIYWILEIPFNILKEINFFLQKKIKRLLKE